MTPFFTYLRPPKSWPKNTHYLTQKFLQKKFQNHKGGLKRKIKKFRREAGYEVGVPYRGGALVSRCPSKCWAFNNDRYNMGKIGITRNEGRNGTTKKIVEFSRLRGLSRCPSSFLFVGIFKHVQKNGTIGAT